MRRALTLAGSAVALSVALAGCTALSDILGGGPGDAVRDDETGRVTESANIDIFSLKVGDCKLASATGEIRDADVVPCDQPHDEEVYYEFKLGDDEYSTAAIDAASEQCVGDAFASFVGISFDQSALDVYPITPTEQTWNELNDRKVQCVIADPAGQVRGSLEGAAR